MEFFDQIGIAKWIVFILPIATFIAINRANSGKPITKAEEQIFTLGIALGGIAMIFGLKNVGVGNFRDSLTEVVHELVGAVFINVVAMLCKMVYTHVATNVKIEGQKNQVSSLDDLANVLRDSQESQNKNTDKLISSIENSQNVQNSNTKKLVEAMESNQIKMDLNFRKLDETLNNFVKELGERLIKQIQEVIETLNDKLTEQLGNNFKRLNDAVNNLVI